MCNVLLAYWEKRERGRLFVYMHVPRVSLCGGGVPSSQKERKHRSQTTDGGGEGFSYLHEQDFGRTIRERKKRKKTDNPREGWEDGTPPPHRDFKERSVVLAVRETGDSQQKIFLFESAFVV